MKAYVLALVVGIACLGGLSLTPTNADAREWRSAGDDAVAVRWRGGTHVRYWYGGTHYWPRYYGGTHYYYPSVGYYPSYNYYNPGYSSYYYSPPVYPSYVAPTYRYYYQPGVRVRVGW